jgi:TP901 family phage tail tape measure protein
MTEVARLSVVVDANVAAAASKLKGVDRQFDKTTASAKKMDGQMAALTASNRRAARGFTELGTSTTAATKSSDRVAPSIDRTEKATKRFGRTTQMARGSMQGMGMGFTPIQAGAVAAGYALGKTIQITSNFDGAMRNVNSIAGLSETQFKSLGNRVNEMARSTAQSPQKLAEGMYDLVSTGYDAEEALKLMAISSKAATAGLTDTATSTSTMTGVLRAYNMKASQAGQVSDDLFKTVELGKINFEQLAQGIGPVLPMAGALGVNLKQVGAAVALMTYQGVPAAESFTYLKGAMTQMVKPSDDLKKAYKRLGVTSGDELVKKTGNLQAALQALYKDSGGNKEKFAKMFPDVRGLTAALQLTGGHAKEAQGFLRGFNNDAGVTNKVFAEQMKATPNKWKQLGADVQATARTYGKELTPALNATATGLSAVSKAAASNTGRNIAKWAPSPLAIPNLAKQAAAGARAVQNVGKGARVGDVKTNFTFKVRGDSDALAKSKKVRSGLMSIPSVRNIAIKVQSPNDVVDTKTRTALNRLGRPLTIRTKVQRDGDVNTVVKPKPVKITADASQARSQAKSFAESVNGLKPRKTKISADSAQAIEAANSAKQAIANVNGKTVIINVQYKPGAKPKGLASGGPVRSAFNEVNERGPESITSPQGHTAMLGDGKRQVMALPIGWHVNTAGETRGMGIGHMAGGGKVKRKKGESMREYRRRVKQIKRDRIDRHNERIDRTSGIRDSKSQKAVAEIPFTVDKDGNTVENTAAIDAKNVARAKRHLEEAKKKKGKDRAPAVAAAQAELAEAKKQQALSAAQAAEQIKATQDNTAAIQAHTDAITDLGKQIAESNRVATTTHNASEGVVRSIVKEIANKGMGGDFGATARTLGPASGASY